MVAVGDDLHDGVASQLGQRFFQELDGPFEVKRVHVAHDDVELALELGAEHRPVALEDEPDVIGFPRLGDLGIDGAGGAVPELARAAVLIERAEDGLERAELAAPADHVVHPAETVVIERGHDSHPRDRPAFAGAVVKHVLAGRVEIDSLKIAEIDRVGAGGPGAAEDVGIGHLEPEAAPAARGMAVEQAGAGIGDGRECALDIGNELFDQGRPAGAVGRAVGEDVMAGAAVGIEHHPDEILAKSRPRTLRDA